MKQTYFIILGLSILMLYGCKTNLTEAFYNHQGNQHYQKENYEAAISKYSKVLEELPTSPQLHYNLGNVLQRQEKMDEAIAEYTHAIQKGDKNLKDKAHYNLGNLYYKQQKPDEAISNYIQALKNNPRDEDAKKNLELAFALRQEQKKKPQQQKQQQKEQEKKQKGQEKQPSPTEKANQELAKRILDRLSQNKQMPKKDNQQKRELGKDW